MKGNFKQIFEKYCMETTILGFKYLILYPDILSRCFWLINMFFLTFLACAVSWLLYTRFATMPTRITIENQYEPAEDFPFPSIVLCSPNQITGSFLKHFNKTLVDGDLTVDLNRVLPMLLGFYEAVPFVNSTDLMQMQALLNLNRYTVSEVMSTIPQSCESFLKLCYYKGVKYKNCNELFSPILTAHGLCCAFNNIYIFKDKRNMRNPFFKPKKVELSGIRDSLTVVVDYYPEDALDGTILYFGATKVMYTDYSEFPAEDESSLVETNVEAYNLISATLTYCSDEVKAMPLWSRKCYMEDEHKLPFFGKYHNSDCDMACYALAVEEACACQLYFLPQPHFGRLCNLTSIPCVMNVKSRMHEWFAKCDCPRDCESRRYTAGMTVGNLNGLQHLPQNIFDDLVFNESTSIMYFYFQTPVYVKQKQETVMSIITFASNVGGVFGLFLGCSGISFLEFCFYIYVAVRNYIVRKIRRGRVHDFAM